jgi:hypothetical protein
MTSTRSPSRAETLAFGLLGEPGHVECVLVDPSDDRVLDDPPQHRRGDRVNLDGLADERLAP